MKNKLLFNLFVLSVILLAGGTSYAQLTVTGTVSDTAGPVPGVNVVVDGTNNGAQTDFDGNYSLANVPSDATLVFSYIGYASQSVAVNGQTTVNVTLSEDVQALNEVVVIGYGTTTVKDATGAVTAVTSEEFNKGVIASPEQLIQGKSAGVQISQTSGEPGAGIDIRIRGANSVRSNNNPLYVVDGIPLSGGTTPEGSNVGFGTSSAKNPLNFLNPNDIESISILKDASATAIYGSRGANGVVIITTKSGRGSRGGSFDYSSSLSISEVRSTYDIMNANEYLAASRLFTTSVADRDFGNDTDWQDFVYRTSTSINNNLSYSNNYGSGNVRATFGYGNQFGVIQNSNLERITGRINLQQRLVNDKLKLGFQGSMSRVNSQSPPLSGSAGFRGDLLGAAYSANPTWPIEADFDSQNGLTNPANLLAYTSDKTNTNRYLLNASAQYNFTPALYGKVNLGYDKSESFRGAATSRLARNVDQGAFGNGVAAINELNNENKLLEATLGYDTDLGNSKLDAVVGYSFQDFNVNGRNISGFGYTTDSLDGMINNLESSANSIESILQGDYQQYGYSNNYAGSAPGSNIFVNRLFPSVTSEFIPTVPNDIAVRALFTDTFDNTDELQSYFGRVNYSIADKYLFTATVRADGSSRFGSDNQYGVFPSGAFAWKMDNEAFVGENVSTLKLRLGVGITGNQEGLGYGNFVSRQRFGGGDVIDDGGTLNIPGTTFVAFAEPGLKWEETLQYAAGLDFGFDNDRLYGSVDVYRKETTDLLFRTDAAQPAVQQFIFRNLPNSKVVNEGVELALGYEVIETDDASFSVNFNVAYNSNLIESLSGQFNAGTIRGQGLTGAFAQKLQEGQPLFSYFLREFTGFDANGQPIQEDVQKFVGKSALPDVTGGLSLSGSYKRLSASVFLAGQFGHYIYNNTQNAFFTAGSFASGRNVPLDVLPDFPAQPGAEAFTAAAEVSTRFLEKGDFIRGQSASISYDFPLEVDALFDSLVFSLTGQNLFVITDYSGLDPEVSTAPAGGDLLNGIPTFGIDYSAFPRPRTFTLGLNAKF